MVSIAIREVAGSGESLSVRLRSWPVVRCWSFAAVCLLVGVDVVAVSGCG